MRQVLLEIHVGWIVTAVILLSILALARGIIVRCKQTMLTGLGLLILSTILRLGLWAQTNGWDPFPHAFWPRVAEWGPLPVFGFGSMLFLAFLAATALLQWQARREGLDPDRVMDLSLWIFLGGLLGARLLFIVRNPQQFQTLSDFFKIWQGGLVFYGGVVAALLIFLGYTRRHKLPAFRVLDVVAPALALGIGIGRFGCLLNGCCWGKVTEPPLPAPFSIQFPFGSIPYMQHLEQDRVSPGFRLWPRGDLELWQRAGSQPVVDAVDAGSWAEAAGLKTGDLIVRLNAQPVAGRETERGTVGGSPLLALLARLKPGSHVELEVSRYGQGLTLAGSFNPEPPHSMPVHPTQIYLALGGWILLGLTMAYYPYRRRPGEVMAVLMVGYAISRFLTELLRGDEPLAAKVQPLSHLVGIEGLTLSQIISLVFFVGGVLMWVWLRRMPASQPADGH